MKRRKFVKNLITTGTAVPVIGMPSLAVAQQIVSKFGRVESQLPVFSNKIKLKLPVFSEHPKSVPISVQTSLPSVSEITLVVENNKEPHTLNMRFNNKVLPKIKTYVSIEETTYVTAIVKSNDKLYFNKVDILIQNRYNCS